jgi:hypothetical protein
MVSSSVYTEAKCGNGMGSVEVVAVTSGSRAAAAVVH